MDEAVNVWLGWLADDAVLREAFGTSRVYNAASRERRERTEERRREDMHRRREDMHRRREDMHRSRCPSHASTCMDRSLCGRRSSLRRDWPCPNCPLTDWVALPFSFLTSQIS